MKRRHGPGARRRQPAIAEGAAVGAQLRAERERQGLTIAQVSAAVRCSERHVVAVEEGREEALPPHPYARGIVVAYAALLGLDPQSAGDAWSRARIAQAPEMRHEPGASGTRRFSWRDWAVPMACAAGAGVFLVLRAAIPPPAAPPEARPPAPVVTRPAAPPAPAADESVPAAPPTPAAVIPHGVRVLLRSEGSTWVDVSADGGELRRQELKPGQNFEVGAQQRLGLSIGDAGVVRIRVNDRELGFIGDKGETKTGLSFTAPSPPRPQAAKAAPAPDGD